MQFGLKESYIEKIRETLLLFPEVEEAVLYGSRAKGNFREGSDIDIAVKGKGIDLTVINKISAKIDDLLLPYIVGITIYDRIENGGLTAHINRAGIAFYKKDTGKSK